jgi:hypothetical protein
MFSMIRRLLVLVATLTIVATVSGCAESTREQATGDGDIRGINAIVTAPVVSFQIEERVLGAVDFKGNSGFREFDDLHYNFNFDLLRPGILEPDRLTTQPIDVLADNEYTVVLTGTIANPSSFFWEDPIREWSGTETVFEIVFAHLAPSMGELDFYFAPPGTVPLLGQAVGTLTNGARLPILEFEEAPYELILTPKDDPATIVYQSAQLAPITQSRATIAVFDADPTLTGNVGVNFIDQAGGSSVLVDVNFPPLTRTYHAAFGTENFDGYFDSDFTSIVYADIGFQELSSYADVPKPVTLVTLTPVGNSGAVIHEADVIFTGGTKSNVVLAGLPGSPFYLFMLNDGRPVETFPIIRILNASLTTDFLDVYLLPPGTPIEDAIIPQIRGIPSLSDTGFNATSEGMLELTITLAGEKTPIAAPVILDLANGDTVDTIIVDTVNPGIVELAIVDFQAAP